MPLFAGLLVTLACSRVGTDISTRDQAAQESGFGAHADAPAWDGWNRYSEYVPARDGTKLAVDVFLPTSDDKEPEHPVPVVLHYTRYIRAYEAEGGAVIGLADVDPVLPLLLKQGYAVAAADARGTGASHGVHHGPFSVEETDDSSALIEWLSAQPWSNGKVGMSGRSYPGITQYQAATRAPPALKAIFAEMAAPTPYDFLYRGGAPKKDFLEVWGASTRQQDLGEAGVAARVDTDVEGVSRDEAIAEHAANLWLDRIIRDGSHLRNFSIDRENGGHWSWDRVVATIDDVDALADSGIGIYHLVGWYDIFTTQQPWLYAALEGRAPQKMMIGPWVHMGGWAGSVHRAEILRWFDYWLKGIDNGVMDEAPIHYYVMEGNHTVPEGESTEAPPTLDDAAAEDPGAWVAAWEWPPAAERRTFWLSGGVSGTIDSVNDGRLVAVEHDRGSVPDTGEGDAYVVDYSSRVGSYSRWMNGYGNTRQGIRNASWFDERTAEDGKVLTYTTEPLGEELTLLGYPTAHLWVTSTHTDGDFFVYLEEIDAEGHAHYVSEGVLRASHRKTSEAPFDNFGLPYHRSYAEDLEPLTPGEPTELVFDIMGTAIVIDVGHRIRVSIAGADALDFEPFPDPLGRDAPRIEILRGGAHASRIELPVWHGG